MRQNEARREEFSNDAKDSWL